MKSSFSLFCLLFLPLLLVNKIQSQIPFYSDCFKGGVTGDGYNPFNFAGPGNLNLTIDPSSSIRKAFLFYNVIQLKDTPFADKESVVLLNSTPVLLNTLNSISHYINNLGSGAQQNFYSYIADVTSSIDPTVNTYTLTPPTPVDPTLEVFFAQFYLVVLYENVALNFVNVDIYINDKNAVADVNYALNASNVIDTASDVGLAIHASNMCDTIQDGSFVSINTVPIGLIGGQEGNTVISCGVTSSFYYQNNILFGIGNDTPDNFMGGLDAIADISPYLLNNTGFNLEFDYQSNLSPKSNTFNQFFLTYTSSCDTFSVSVSNDTTVCYGSQTQLNASGGQTYEWLPATGLSCSDCPNPVFTADSAMHYTVRIWNNDTCSVVRPLKINVSPLPTFSNLVVTPTNCGTTNGEIIVSASSTVTGTPQFSMDAGTPQTLGTFSNLAQGSYSFTITDGLGCVSEDTMITVGVINPTVASFTIDPTSGLVPLNVNITNTSQNASDFSWSINGVNQGGSLNSQTLYNAGTYSFELAAWQYDPSCADTVSITVTVLNEVIIPTAFTPNNDFVNDHWDLENLDEQYPKNTVQIFNRWGNLLFESIDGTYSQHPWTGKYKGELLPVSSYYYIIEPNDGKTESMKGTVSILK